jgi:hypothetical protein
VVLVALCLAALIYILSKVAGINTTLSVPKRAEVATSVSPAPDTLPTRDTSTRLQDTLLKPLPQNEEKTSTREVVEKKYLVVAASFPEEAMAQKELERLLRLGYEDCELGYFNQRKIISVIAGRFDEYGEALAFAKKMNDMHNMEAYVHRKRLE